MSAPSAASQKASLNPSNLHIAGTKYSRQRELVYQAVAHSDKHPTADAVYQQVRKICPEISLGTVYRNLGRLVECGLLRKIGVPDGSDHFDGTLREHYHLFCLGCGCVADVDLPELRALAEKVREKTGFTVTEHDLILRGYCKGCEDERIKYEEENE